eukprot:m.459080 g.459080  ORF g.459080 m.459080 type:complete len:303 (-) comp21665_c0_seq1:51-959(-)
MGRPWGRPATASILTILLRALKALTEQQPFGGATPDLSLDLDLPFEVDEVMPGGPLPAPRMTQTRQQQSVTLGSRRAGKSKATVSSGKSKGKKEAKKRIESVDADAVYQEKNEKKKESSADRTSRLVEDKFHPVDPLCGRYKVGKWLQRQNVIYSADKLYKSIEKGEKFRGKAKEFGIVDSVMVVGHEDFPRAVRFSRPNGTFTIVQLEEVGKKQACGRRLIIKDVNSPVRDCLKGWRDCSKEEGTSQWLLLAKDLREHVGQVDMHEGREAVEYVFRNVVNASGRGCFYISKEAPELPSYTA